MQTSRPLALITGASSGIGACFARRLAARGYDLALVARRKEKLDELAAELQAGAGVHAETIAADLAKDSDRQVVEEYITGAGNLELLVNNAGFGTLGRFHEVNVEGQDQMYRLHVLATARLTHAALPGMIARGRGGVINVSSVAAFWQTPFSVSYCSTKAWINAFTESLYLELKAAGSPVRVQALCPGFTYTEFHDVMGVDRKRIPDGFWMSADDVVEASLSGLDEGRLFVVPGWRYRAIVVLSKILPQALRHAAIARYAKKSGRDRAPARVSES
jgi:uncharacterized protein